MNLRHTIPTTILMITIVGSSLSAFADGREYRALQANIPKHNDNVRPANEPSTVDVVAAATAVTSLVVTLTASSPQIVQNTQQALQALTVTAAQTEADTEAVTEVVEEVVVAVADVAHRQPQPNSDIFK